MYRVRLFISIAILKPTDFVFIAFEFSDEYHLKESIYEKGYSSLVSHLKIILWYQDIPNSIDLNSVLNQSFQIFVQKLFKSKCIASNVILTWCRDNRGQNGGFPRVRSVHCTADRLTPATEIGHVIYWCGDLRSRSSLTKSNFKQQSILALIDTNLMFPLTTVFKFQNVLQELLNQFNNRVIYN